MRELPVAVWLVPARRDRDNDLLTGDVDNAIKRAKSGSYSGSRTYAARELPVKISRKDPAWDTWRNKLRADCLVVLADIPKVFADADRRAAVSLDKQDWDGYRRDPQIVVEISEAPGVKVENGPKP